MKTKIIIPIVVLSLVLITKSVFAENETITGTPKTVRNQIKEELQQEKPEVKKEIKEVKEEKKSKLSELKLKKSQAIYNEIRLKLTKRHAYLLKIKAKLEARIAKNPTNKDTSTAVAKLQEFDAVEALYNKELALFDAKFIEITTSGTTIKSSQLVTELKGIASVTKTYLGSIKKILREATVLLAQGHKLEVKETE